MNRRIEMDIFKENEHNIKALSECDYDDAIKLANELQKAKYLNDILLNSIPHPALLVRKDRSVIAANKIALEQGTKVGGFCWKDWGACLYISEEDKKRVDAYSADDDKPICCNFCKGDATLTEEKTINIKKKLGDIYWDIYWVPTQEKGIYLHYAIDITMQKKIEENLRESEERFRQLAEASFEGICIQYKGIIKDCNKRMESLFGYRINEMIGMSLSNLITTVQNADEENELGSNVYFGICKDGRKIPVEIMTRRINFNGNKAEVFIIRNTSKNERTEETVKRIKDSLKASQAMARIGHIEFDALSKKTYWSDEVFSILGYKPKEIVPKWHSLKRHIHKDERKMVRKQCRDRNAFETLLNFECRFTRVDGSQGWLHIKGEIEFINNSRQLFRCFLMLQDISERKKAELVNEINRENIKFLEEAREMDRIKTEFLANVSHEFRTPLNIIFGSVQLFELYIQNGMIDDKKGIIGKRINSMKQNCNRLMRLINNLIDITKIDTGFMQLKPKNTDIIKMLEKICMSMNEYIKAKDLDFEYNTNVKSKVIACDPDKIERIVLNLLSNAIKFNKHDGSIKVSVSQEKNNIVITIEDSGIGISKDKQEKIFDRFAQADKSITRLYEGSGIGLALVKSFVEMHKGEIRLESEVGEGSKFTFTLPDKKLKEDNTMKQEDNFQEDLSNYIERMDVEFSDIYI